MEHAILLENKAPAGAHLVAPSLDNTDSVYVKHRDTDSVYVNNTQRYTFCVCNTHTSLRLTYTTCVFAT